MNAGKQYLTQLLTEDGSAGFAGHDQTDAAPTQEIGGPGQVSALPCPVDAFESNELSALHRDRWYLFTARLCSASVKENSWLPSPRATK